MRRGRASSARCFCLRAKSPRASWYRLISTGRRSLRSGAILTKRFDYVRELGTLRDIAVVNSINPHRIEGQKTASFEIIEEPGDAPDLHILPVGNAGNITAYWKGYNEFHQLGKSKTKPRMMGFQAAGSAPIVENRVIEEPNTVATAIRIGNPASWQGANTAVAESTGAIDSVTDEEILAAQKWLASNEGIFVEPASAASVAGLFKLGSTAAKRIVLTVTGHGLKDPDTAMTTGDYHPLEAEADLNAIREFSKPPSLMPVVVQKYGGTSVGTPERILNVARRVLETQQAGNSVVVVVSAMSGVTDGLIKLAKQVSETPTDREMDVLLSTGEQTTIALTAMAINALGGKAISLTGLRRASSPTAFTPRRRSPIFRRARSANISRMVTFASSQAFRARRWRARSRP